MMPNSPEAPAESTQSQFQPGDLNVVLLAGGVGGAKLADGLAQVLSPEHLTIVVNSGDDFQYLGLTICPDLDTVMYTLAGVANPETGWGRIDETWRTMEEVGRLGGPDWFRLGDLDLAAHLTRSHMLANGGTLTEATQHLCRHLGVKINLLPMSNQPSPTTVETDQGMLPFQTWFVAERWQPAVKRIHFPDDVRATPQVLAALEEGDLIVIAPSNPFVSIDPILNVYPIRAMVADLPKLVIAVSPIVAGKAVKGPAAKMMKELGMPVSAASVASYYGELIDAFVYDRRDSDSFARAGLVGLQTDTLMHSRDDRRRLASQILQFSTELINR